MLLHALAVSLTGFNVLRPVHTSTGELVDFVIEYLNPAAQRMTGLGERPGGTMRTRFPDMFPNGVFAVYRHAFETGEEGRYGFNYQADGYDNYFRLAAQRSGELLLVSFTDTSDQDRTPVEQALRASQAAEKIARAEAESQRQRLHDILMQMPAQVAINRGPDHVYELVNPRYQQQFPGRVVQGRTVREALPELEGQQFYELLDQVYQTGEPFYGRAMPAAADYISCGQQQLRYFDVFFQALRDGQGHIDGILNFAYDVTAQVEARQQVEHLNQELEARVAERTREALSWQADLLAAAQRQAQEREELYQVFEQAPVVVALLRGPEHFWHYRNPAFQRLFPGRVLTSRLYAEAMPEIVAAGLIPELDRVYATGRPYEGTALPLVVTPPDGSAPHQRYYDFSYQPYREQGRIVGVSIFAYDVTDQVRARQEREAQQRRLYAAFEQAPIGIAIQTGPEFVYEFHNASYLWMVPDRQLVGRRFFDVFPEMAGTHVETLLRHVYETGETQQELELLIPVARADGSAELEDRYFTIVYQARRDEQGSITGILAFVMEVTEQVRARRVVEASEQQVRALVENAPFLIGMYVGPELRIHLANQVMLDGLGKGPDIIGQRYADVVPEMESHGVLEQMHQVLATGQALHLRHQRLEVVMHGTPQTFYYNYSFIPLRDAEGQVYGLLNTAVDVTDLVQARQRIESYAAELQESEARFRTMADATPNAVWALHPDSSVRYGNRAFLQFLGVSLDQLLAENWVPYVHPDELPLTQQTMMQAIADGTLFSLETRMRRHDGQYRWLLTQGAPSYLASGELYGYVGSNIDITDLKQANEQLRRTNADLDNFIYTASHDLKAPIGNIEGLLHALEHALPPAGRVGEVPTMLHLMQQAVERFGRTIAHLTDISRLQQEHEQPTSLVSLARVVVEVQLDLAPLMAQSQAQVRVDVPADVTISFSEKNLRSVVYNLLSNALKYRHPERLPEVSVRYARQAAAHVLEVQDNGLGLDLTQDQGKLFAMFQRLHTHVEGTGIGLYMVKKMLENAGGHIEVDSQPGRGTTFRVYFPLT